MTITAETLKRIKLINEMKSKELSIEDIAKRLGVSSRGAYRAIKVLREDEDELFELKEEKISDSRISRYSIIENKPVKIFTTEETSYLVPLIKQQVEQSPLSESILHKVIANSKFKVSGILQNTKYSKMVSNITDCIDKEKQIEIIGYRSSNSGKISREHKKLRGKSH